MAAAVPATGGRVTISREALVAWCRVPREALTGHPDLRVPFRIVADAGAMGELMAHELFDLVVERAGRGLATRAIVPCGPMSWYEPFARLVNEARQSLETLVVFHMDECLDWQGRLLPAGASDELPQRHGARLLRSGRRTAPRSGSRNATGSLRTTIARSRT